MYFVADTNVLISASLLEKSIPRKAIETARSQGKLLISSDVVGEYESRLKRAKLNKYVPYLTRQIFLGKLLQTAIPVEIKESIEACRDPKDNKFLELGVSGHADYIITGDQDLLDLHPFRGISILTPRQFLEAVPSKK